MGEFARSAAIARAALLRWPAARIHFVLSRAAPYAASVPFPATLLPASATLHSAEVIEIIQSFRPHVVVFDNAGRSAQLKAAHRAGARIVYISSRRRQRAKAFRLRWMRLIDEHWIAYPRFIAGPFSALERCKLALLGRPAVRYLDVIFSRPAPAGPGSPSPGPVLVVPGGGTGHPGARDAPAQFSAAAQGLAARGFEVRYVGPAPPQPAPASAAQCQFLGALPQEELARLMQHAALVVVNGGSTLLQAIACGAACVAVPIARDQRLRIRRCVQAGVALAASADALDIEAKAASLLADEPRRAALARRARALELADGVEVALEALGRLIGRAP